MDDNTPTNIQDEQFRRWVQTEVVEGEKLGHLFSSATHHIVMDCDTDAFATSQWATEGLTPNTLGEAIANAYQAVDPGTVPELEQGIDGRVHRALMEVRKEIVGMLKVDARLETRQIINQLFRDILRLSMRREIAAELREKEVRAATDAPPENVLTFKKR